MGMMERLGLLIREIRKQRGMTTAELARKSGYTSKNSHKQIEHIEGGRRGTQVERLERIAQALGLELEFSLVPQAAELDDQGAAILVRLSEVLPLVDTPDGRRTLLSVIDDLERLYRPSGGGGHTGDSSAIQ